MSNLNKVAPLLDQLDQIRLQLFRLIGEMDEDTEKDFAEIRRLTTEMASKTQDMLFRTHKDRRVIIKPIPLERRTERRK